MSGMFSKLKPTGLSITLKYRPGSFCAPSIDYDVLGGYANDIWPNPESFRYVIARFQTTPEWPAFDVILKVEDDWLSFVDSEDPESMDFNDPDQISKFQSLENDQPFRLNGIVFRKLSEESLKEIVADKRFAK